MPHFAWTQKIPAGQRGIKEFLQNVSINIIFYLKLKLRRDFAILVICMGLGIQIALYYMYITFPKLYTSLYIG